MTVCIDELLLNLFRGLSLCHVIVLALLQQHSIVQNPVSQG